MPNLMETYETYDGLGLAAMVRQGEVSPEMHRVSEAYGDDNDNPDGLAALFAEHAVWESQGLGRYEGREAIRDFFRGASELFTFAIHDSLNGHIEVTGDTARAQWSLFMPCTIGADNRAAFSYAL